MTTAQQQKLLADPEAQNFLINHASEMMKDPEMQALAKKKGLQVADAGLHAAAAFGGAFQKYVEEGPAGISMLCFLTSIFTMIVMALDIVNIFQVLFDPFTFVMSAYVLFFSTTTFILEADPDTIATWPVVERLAPHIRELQKTFFEYAKFLTHLIGRGAFYVFIGLVLITQCWFCLFFIAGAANITVGALCIMLHFGYKPDFDKFRQNTLAAAHAAHAAADASGAYSVVSAYGGDGEYSKASAAFSSPKASGAVKKDIQLKALYAQAEKGDVSGPRPSGMFEAGAKADYDNWKKLQGMDASYAKKEFVRVAKAKGLKF